MNQGIEKGTFALILAQILFVLSGYVLHAGLGRIWGPERYGLFVVIISVLVWVELATTSGLPTGVGKRISENEGKTEELLSLGLRIQLVLSLSLIAIVFLSAPLFSFFLKDPKLTFYLRLASVDVPFMGLLVLYWNVLGGLRAFGRRAIGIIVYCVFKTTIILVLVIFEFSIAGALIGNIVASIVAFLAASQFLLPPKKDYSTTEVSEKGSELRPEGHRVVTFAIPYTIYYFSYNLLIILDLLLVKSLLKDSTVTGYYASAHSVAKIPYFVFYAFSATLLPLLSNSISHRDRELTLSYIKRSLRFLLMLLVPCILLVSETSGGLISLIYSRAYAQAAPVLSILVFGFGFLSVFLTLNTMLIANNQTKRVLLITLSLIPLSLFLNFKLIPIHGIQGAAIATTVTTAVGAVVTSMFVYESFRTLTEIKSSVRILISGMIVFFVSKSIRLEGTLIIWKYAIAVPLYFALLYLLREITSDEIDRIRFYFMRLRSKLNMKSAIH